MFYILNPTNKSAARPEHVVEYTRHGYKVCVMIAFHLQIFTHNNNNNNNNNNKVIIGATGIVTRSLKKNLETVPGKHSIDSLQKTAILGTSHIIQKVLQCEA